jgi:hypothetical protein
MRQALVLQWANATFAGTFRWMVLADDDTLLFVQRLHMQLRRLDHELPMLLGQVIAGINSTTASNHAGQPGWPAIGSFCDSRWLSRKTPCRVSWLPNSQCTAPGMAMPARSVPSSCAMDEMGRVGLECRECFCPVSLHGSGHYELDEEHGRASLTPAAGIPYGGLGIVLSEGLLRSISPTSWRKCVHRLPCGPSDFRIATCVQNLVGIGATELTRYAPWAPVNDNTFFRSSHSDLEDVLSVTESSDWPWSAHKVGVELTRFLLEHFRRSLRRRSMSGVFGTA